MPVPIPQPGDVANRAAAVFEQELPPIYAALNPGAPPATVDARSNVSTLAVHGRVLDMAVQDLWFYLPRVVQELMPDTAIDWLPRHAAIWGVPQLLAQAAIGNVIFVGANETNIPAGTVLSAPGTGAIYTTSAAATIGTSGTVSVAVAAAVAGSAGSQPASTVLNVVNAIGGLTAQTATVDSNGLTGEDAETMAAWQARLLARIRNRGSGGNATDFEDWTKACLPGALVTAMSPGTGFITVAFAMPSGSTWRVPTAPEIATLTAYLNDATQRKPLGAPVITVVGATLQPINFTLALNADSTLTEAGATSALTLQLLADATIGGTVYMNRTDAAISNISGAYSFERTAPTADVTAAATTLSVMGTVTF